MDITYLFSGKSVLTVPVILVLGWFIIGILLGRRISAKKHNQSDNRREKSRYDRKNNDDNIEIYVGNLSYDVDEKDLRREFEKYGKVTSARIIENKSNGKSKGFGFVEMLDQSEATEAIRAVNGKELKGRRVVANEAKSQARNGG